MMPEDWKKLAEWIVMIIIFLLVVGIAAILFFKAKLIYVLLSIVGLFIAIIGVLFYCWFKNNRS